jgi:chromosome segregation ATPase
MGFISALQSKKGKKFMSYLYGWGAAIVIIGAMFKIQHWPGASEMLVAGLSIEAVIFFFSAFEPIHEEIDWSLVYPELRGEHGHGHGDHAAVIEEETSITEQLDKMLEEAKIEPELLASLGTGLRSLSDQASKLNNITDASVATNEYVSNIKSASESAGALSNSYNKAANSITESVSELGNSYSNVSKALDNLAASNQESLVYGEELQKVSKNLTALNAVYELQYQSASEHLKSTTQFNEGVGELMKNLHDSIDDTKKYKENISELSKNLTALNTVYGNMLNAMNFRGQ